MQSAMAVLFAALALLLAALEVLAEDDKVTPIAKVITMLNGMLEKGKKEKHEEEVQFASYKQFCDDTTVEKKKAIEHAGLAIEKLKADIEAYTIEAETLAE